MASDGFDEAVRELYAADLDEFTAVRATLVVRAKKTSTATVANRIGALRKPTRSAWTVNQLARSAAAELSEFFALGDALRAAQSALDGAQLRELSAQRRQVVDALVSQALDVTGQPNAPPALRDEVRATLDAALADPDVRADVVAGALVRAAHWSGFGDAPALTVVPPPGRTPQAQPLPRQREAHLLARQREAKELQEQRAAELAARQRENARAAVDRTDTAVSEAVASEKDQQRQVRLAQDQLADARRRLDEARVDLRHARSEQAKAVKALRELS